MKVSISSGKQGRFDLFVFHSRVNEQVPLRCSHPEVLQQLVKIHAFERISWAVEIGR